MNRNSILWVLLLLLAIAVVGVGAVHLKNLQRAAAAQNATPVRAARILSDFEVFHKPRVVNPDRALGHRFSLAQGEKVYIVHLYFVECPPVDAEEAQTTAVLGRLSRYFGSVPFEKLLKAGADAKARTLALLGEDTMRMVTRFQPSRTREGFHAFILLGPDGRQVEVAEVLVREGLAAIQAEGSYLPYGESQETYRNHLIRLENEARAEKRGIWAHSRNPDEGGAGGAASR